MQGVAAVCYCCIAVAQHYCNNQENVIITALSAKSKARKVLEEALLQWPFSSHKVILAELVAFLTLSEKFKKFCFCSFGLL